MSIVRPAKCSDVSEQPMGVHQASLLEHSWSDGCPPIGIDASRRIGTPLGSEDSPSPLILRRERMGVSVTEHLA